MTRHGQNWSPSASDRIIRTDAFMRTFIAIELNQSVKEALHALSNRLRRSGVRASWVKPEAMHLTLRFLGEISEETADRIGDLLTEGYKGFTPFMIHVRGVGAFPELRKPSVVWAGVLALEGNLTQAQAVAEQAAVAVGLPPEERAYHPHLTLGRVKSRDQIEVLADYLSREQTFDGGAFRAMGVSLFSSKLTPKGPLYTRLRECRF